MTGHSPLDTTATSASAAVAGAIEQKGGPTVKVVMDVDEWFPVMVIRDDARWGGKTVEVPDDTVERFRRVQEEWDSLQNELRKLWGQHHAKHQ